MQTWIRRELAAAIFVALTACDATPSAPDAGEVPRPEGAPPIAPPATPIAQKGPVPFVWSSERGIEEIALPVDAIRGHVVAINSTGEVAGVYQPAGAMPRVFVWSRARGIYVLPSPPGQEGLVGVIDINDRGEVLGAVSFAWAPTISFIWSPAAGFKFIGRDDGDILANDVNNRGEVVGLRMYQYGNPSAPSVAYEAFLWDQIRGFHKMPSSGQYQLATATQINDAGEIVGLEADSEMDPATVRKGGRLLRWSSGFSQPVALAPSLPPDGCDNWWSGDNMSAGCGDVTAINVHGEAVGSLNGRAFRSGPGNVPVFLNSNEGRASFATGINDAGLVAGYTVSNPGFGAVIKSFVWHPDGTVTRLPNLSGRPSTFATAINASGEVVGIAR